MNDTKRRSLAITRDQRDEIAQAGFPYGLYPAVLSLLLLAYWRWEVDKEIAPWFSHKYSGGEQHVCKVGLEASQLYGWFRLHWPTSTARAIVTLGLSTVQNFKQQGYTMAQIEELIQITKSTIWGNPGQ